MVRLECAQEYRAFIVPSPSVSPFAVLFASVDTSPLLQPLLFFFFCTRPNACAHLVGWPRFLSLCGQILAMVDGLMVHQEVETLEAIANAIGIGYEGNNQ